jgi:uncharacterized membrane protein
MDGYTILWGSILLLFFIFVPGYALSLAVFPRRGEISVVERLGLSMILGVVPHGIIYLLNKNLGVEITSLTSFLVILLVTAAGLFHWKNARKTVHRA